VRNANVKNILKNFSERSRDFSAKKFLQRGSYGFLTKKNRITFRKSKLGETMSNESIRRRSGDIPVGFARANVFASGVFHQARDNDWPSANAFDQTWQI
jgi:hypothetical protein